MYIWISFFTVSLMLLAASLICYADHRRRRPRARMPSLSFLVPCYNDGDTVEDTLCSIFTSCNGASIDVLVANDASTDNSAEILHRLKNELPIRIVHNPANLGKAETLNLLSRLARHDVLVFLDADTLLNARALNDMTARLGHDPRLGAVSCPYRPANRGWLPRLQSIDYSMISMLQGAYNVFSGLALWGGCIAVRKQAFEAAGRFSSSAITEDVHLAYSLNRIGWRVEQSLIPVASHVPSTCRLWMKQKIRWTAGGFQCLIRHPSVWLRNPLQVILIMLYSALSLNAAYALFRQVFMLDRFFDLMLPLVNRVSARQVFHVLEPLYGAALMNSLQLMLCFTLLSAIYVVPLISKWKDCGLLLLIIPFSLGYFPLYTLLSVAGLFYLMTNARRINRTLRAW